MSNSNVSIGGGSGSDPARQSNEPARPDAASKTLGEADKAKPGDDASRYGEEGTNKTMPKPKPGNAPSDEPGGNVPHIPKSPYTRG